MELMHLKMEVFLRLIFVLIIGFVLIDIIAIQTEPFEGIVIDKNYKAKVNSFGTGYGIANNGKSDLILSSQYESEKFLLMVKIENGDIVTVKCDPKLYYKKSIKDRLNCNAYKGFLSGITYLTYGVY
jgi:hypothetical protein